MKILVMTSHTPSLIWFRLDMILSFIKEGYTVVAVGNEPVEKWQKEFDGYGIKYRQAYIERNGTDPLKDLKTLRQLKKIIKNERPDKIFTYQAKTVIYGGIAAHKYRVDTYSLIAGLGSIFLKTSIKSKIVRTILIKEYRISLKHSKTVFFQNDDDISTFLNNKIVRKEQVVKLNGSGVNLEKFYVSSFPEKFAFLFIGRLIKDKGICEYLEACKLLKNKHKEVRCLLVGPYDTNPSSLSENELSPYITDGTMEYFGEQKDVQPYISQCNVFVLPSYREGTPKTVLEAMACGRAIITTNAPGCRETIKENRNGILVNPYDTNGLFEAMEYLYLNNEIAIQMGIESRKIAEEIFDVKKVNNEILKRMKG